MNINQLSAQDILGLYTWAGYSPLKVQPGSINIFGIRNKDRKSNAFDDIIGILFFDQIWQVKKFKATTDPGKNPRIAPKNPKGVAIVAPGFYPDLWKVGMHKGRYPALVQHAPITVYRDNDGNGELNMHEGKTETGFFGINCHHASATGESTIVNGWSEGCQVLASIAEWDAQFWPAVLQHQKSTNSSPYSYALFSN